MRHTFTVFFVSITILAFASTIFPCSTFILKEEDILLVGHNLDENSFIPGRIVVNKRGITKEGVSFEELRTGIKKRISSTHLDLKIRFNNLQSPWP